MHPNAITGATIDAAIHIHKGLGPGLLESVYEAVLADELTNRGFHVLRQAAVPLTYNGRHFDTAFRADLVIEDQVIVEIKSIEAIADVHLKQLLTYLRLANKPLGLLINFNTTLIKQGIRRVVNNLQDLAHSPPSA